MRTQALIRGLLVLFFAMACTNATHAGCRLPMPDGGAEHPSAANLQGRITRIIGSDILLRQAQTGRIVRVRLPEKPEIYTAFGGPVSLSELAPGQTVWVWFQDCKWVKAGPPTSAYFQIYSKDPNDRP